MPKYSWNQEPCRCRVGAYLEGGFLQGVSCLTYTPSLGSHLRWNPVPTCLVVGGVTIQMVPKNGVLIFQSRVVSWCVS